MRKGRSNKKTLFIFAGVMAAGLIGSTMAYASKDLSAENRFHTGKYDTVLKDEFVSPDNWAPGITTESRVSIVNNGTIDVVARAAFSDLWERTEDIYDRSGSLVEPNGKKGSILASTFTDETGKEQDAAIKNWEPGQVVTYSEGMDLSAMSGKWVWYDGYYYYMGSIKSNKESSRILESVTMNPILDSVVTGSTIHTYVDSTGENKSVITDTYGKYGYDRAKYTLTIKAQTVQAARNVVENIWESNPVTDYIVKHYMTAEQGSDMPGKTLQNTPKTEDKSKSYVWVCLGIAAFAVFCLVLKRKKKGL